MKANFNQSWIYISKPLICKERDWTKVGDTTIDDRSVFAKRYMHDMLTIQSPSKNLPEL